MGREVGSGGGSATGHASAAIPTDSAPGNDTDIEGVWPSGDRRGDTRFRTRLPLLGGAEYDHSTPVTRIGSISWAGSQKRDVRQLRFREFPPPGVPLYRRHPSIGGIRKLHGAV